MKQILIKMILVTMLGMSSAFAKECTIDVLRSKNYSTCLKLSSTLNLYQAKQFCGCIERNMDWEFMLKENTFIDRRKCEFFELEKLISEKEVLEKCPR